MIDLGTPEKLARFLALTEYERHAIEAALREQFPQTDLEELARATADAIEFARAQQEALTAEVERHDRAIGAEHDIDQTMHDPEENT